MQVAEPPKHLASAPLDSEGARHLLQQRITLMSGVILVFGVMIQSVMRWAAYSVHNDELPAGPWTRNAHLAIVGLQLASWLYVRAGRRSERALRFFDIANVLVPTAFSMSALWGVAPKVNPMLLNLLGVGNVLVLRAVLVPSTGRRTAALGAIVNAALIVWIYAYTSLRGPPLDAPPFLFAVAGGMWATMNLILTTLASHTIFGLRERVREASELGQYTLLRKIGAGGMGIVYEARHALLRRRTAVKLLPAHLSGEQNAKRFEREVQLTATLTHPNTIAIYDYGKSPDGVFYYAMEYLEGVDLEQLVQKTGAQPPALVVRVLEQLCAALADAHAHGLIHRDIKPANVFVCERGGMLGFVKVMDFGLVKQVSPGGDLSLSGAVDTILGTPLYLSPEAIARPERVDARSDLYAVGAVGYWLLTGAPLFDGRSSVEVCGHHLHTVPVAPSARLGAELPGELETLILACLEKDPERRPESAARVGAMLAAMKTALPWSDEEAQTWWSRCRVLNSEPPPERAFEPTARLRTVEMKKRAGLS